MIDKAINILAIETATSSCSVALACNNKIFSREQVGNNIHSNVVLKMVHEVLQEAQITNADLSAVAVGQGPGSFTGLRIGIGVAQGIAYGVNIPMIGISSLDALANQAPSQGRVIAGIDARMGEVYWCEYLKSNDDVQRLGELKVSPPNEILCEDAAEKIELVGNAWAEYQGKFSSELIDNSLIIESQVYPMAESLLDIAINAFESGDVISAIDFTPEYVRNNVAKKSTKGLKR